MALLIYQKYIFFCIIYEDNCSSLSVSPNSHFSALNEILNVKVQWFLYPKEMSRT